MENKDIRELLEYLKCRKCQGRGEIIIQEEAITHRGESLSLDRYTTCTCCGGSGLKYRKLT